VTRSFDARLRAGHFASQQIFSGNPLIAWSHRRRFETGLELTKAFAGRRVLDYGCGDGTFLALLASSTEAPAVAVGAEIDPFWIDDCRTRLGQRAGLSFVSIESLAESPHHHARYDAVVCMEVLEHVIDLDPVIDELWSLLAADGTLLVSVPVETGVPLVVKQIVRRAAGWFGVGDYSRTPAYSWREYRAGLFAGAAPHLARQICGGSRPRHDHKGFNWMALRDRLSHRFVLERVVVSPFPSLGPQFATQVWFVARKAPGPSGLPL
jgi:SAM-dependent methyltransferase